MFLVLLTKAFKPISRDCDENFKYFVQFYNKTYDDDSHAHEVFCANFQKLLEAKNCTTCAVTCVFDRTSGELAASKPLLDIKQVTALDLGYTCYDVYCYALDPLSRLTKGPVSVDLREWGLVTRAKDYKTCGSCWCFAAVAYLENAALIDQKKSPIATYYQNAKNLRFSEQFFLRNAFNRQAFCDGENSVTLLNYVIDKIPSVELNDNYAYDYSLSYQLLYKNEVPLEYKLARDQYNLPFKVYPRIQNPSIYGTPQTPIVSLMGTSYRFDGERVMSYLARGIAVLAIMYTDETEESSFEFSAYDGEGIIAKYGCRSERSNHYVLFIGYGVKNGEKVWLMRNSWGDDWGNDGAFYIRYGHNDLCIENYAYAVVPKYYNPNDGVFEYRFETPYDIYRGRNGFDVDDGQYVTIEFKYLIDISLTTIIVSTVSAIVLLAIVACIVWKCCRKPYSPSTMVYIQERYFNGKPLTLIEPPQ